MAKRKLDRYSALSHMENVIELSDYAPDTVSEFRGRWAEKVFGNASPLVLELACGKGDYTLQLARRYPNKNFIGVDVKGDRLWRGAISALENKLMNVRFLRIYIDHITNYFAQNEVSEIWITFPDPYLGKKKILKRLTSPVFLERYRQIACADAPIHLKTDSPELFEYTLEIIEEQNLKVLHCLDDVHGKPHMIPDLDIRTYYEQMHLEDGRTIRYESFRL